MAATGLLVTRRVLIGSEGLQVNRRGIERQSGELLPGNEPTPVPERDQLANRAAVASDRK